MDALATEICGFLRGNGFDCVTEQAAGVELLRAGDRHVLPWSVDMHSLEDAQRQAEAFRLLLDSMTAEGIRPIVITEDRWRRQGDMMRARLLAHLEVFTPLYARNCEVRRIDRNTASAFLEENHSYGDASCRHRYGMYLKRYTGNASDRRVIPGTLVAVATFSNARKWQKGDKTIRSYEWTRYASLPGVRISGGMGRMLRAFIEDVRPDDVMSYADLEWSEGAVYEQLGFSLEGITPPVLFQVDGQWRRCRVRPGQESGPASSGLFLQNLGSNKYRLKLTEYE